MNCRVDLPSEPNLHNEDEKSASTSQTNSSNHRESISDEPELNEEDLSFREVTSETISSTSVLGKRILRQYSSEFVLPDDTRISISRKESTYPSDGVHQVVISVASGLPNPSDPIVTEFHKYCQLLTDSGTVTTDTCTSTTDDTSHDFEDDSGEDVSMRKNSASNHSLAEKKKLQKKLSQMSSWPQLGLRIVDYIDDDPWAASMLECDASTEGDLLRQLEAGCRLNPEAYQMERVQRKKNYCTVVDLKSQPQVRTIGLSRAQSEADSIHTQCTEVEA